MATLLSIHAPDGDSVNSHQLRLAITLSGGALDDMRLSGQARAEMRRRFRSSGSLVLVDADAAIRDPMTCIEYIAESRPMNQLMPESPPDRAFIREAARPLLSPDMDDFAAISDQDRLGAWVAAGRLLLAGGGRLAEGLIGARMADTILDCAYFPILHRTYGLIARRELRMPDSTATPAVLEYMTDRYGDDRYLSAMTREEINLAR